MFGQASAIELDSNQLIDKRAEHLAAVIGAIWFSVAFLEAAINEVFESACEPGINTGYFGTTNSLKPRSFSVPWVEGRGKSLSTLEKYSLALALAEKSPFGTHDTLLENVKILILFRNSLTHFNPEWVPIDHDSQGPHKMSNRLRNRFTKHPRANDTIMVFPLAFLSADCARWAIDSAISFAELFFNRLKSALFRLVRLFRRERRYLELRKRRAPNQKSVVLRAYHVAAMGPGIAATLHLRRFLNWIAPFPGLLETAQYNN